MGPYGAKGPKASQLRQRKHALARRFGLPAEALGGALSKVYRKCGKASCHCASGEGHPMWTLTYRVEGAKHVEFIPADLVTVLEPLTEQGRAYREALREIMTINAQLVTLFREQQRTRKPRR